jgi:predicted RND superfamily exporter protein
MSFQKFAEFLDRRRNVLSGAFALLAVVSSFYVVKLYGNLKPDIEELLPTSSRSVKDLKEVTSRLRSIDNLAVLLFSKDSNALGKFQEDLAQELLHLPTETSAGIEYKISDEINFFQKRKSLFISTKDLKDVREFIKSTIDYQKFIYNPINLVIENKPTEPQYDFLQLENRYSSRSDEFSHFPGGIYATPDGTKRLILVYSTNQSITTAHQLKTGVVDAINHLDPKKYAPDLEVKYSGGVQDIIEEQGALMEDLMLSTGLVTILVSLILCIYYRSIFATAALIGSLMVGTIFTFGISYFVVGYLNANSAFLGSIVMGNGINFGIMILARYLEERRSNNQTHIDALVLSLKETYLATLTAALAAGLAYGSLMLTSFRGFSQFGMIGVIGMASCWICAYTFFPAFLSVMDRNVDLIGKDRRTESRSMWARGIQHLLTHYPVAVMTVGILVSLIAIYGTSQVSANILETDLTKLRDRRSMEEGSGYLSHYVDLILKRYSGPIAVLAHKPEEADQIAAKLRKKKADFGHDSLIDSVMTVDDFVPSDQKEKIRELKSIKALLPPQLLWRMDDAEKKRIADFTSSDNMTAFGIDDLPPKLLEKFREKNGALGDLVLVEPPMTNEVRQGDELVRFVKSIRESVDAVGPNIPVAGRLPVTADMIEAIKKDGPKATLISGLAVVALTIVLFRNLELSILVLGSLFLGVTWMVGAIVLFKLKINFLNFIALPITFGIGVDYAVNIFARFKEEHQKIDVKHAMVRAAYHTGGAVVLASCTTIIGWGSLLIAGNQAFVSFGKIAVLGEITCVTVAVLIIPASLILLRRGKSSS